MSPRLVVTLRPAGSLPLIESVKIGDFDLSPYIVGDITLSLGERRLATLDCSLGPATIVESKDDGE